VLLCELSCGLFSHSDISLGAWQNFDGTLQDSISDNTLCPVTAVSGVNCACKRRVQPEAIQKWQFRRTRSKRVYAEKIVGMFCEKID
jgi:hypothetical protein